MLTETTSAQRLSWRAETARVRRALLDRRLLLVVALAVLAGALAYQAPTATDIPVGWLGDRLFLQASEGQSAADELRFYGDEITADASTGRSRWTHAGALLRLPGLGPGDVTVTVRAQGWPGDAIRRDVRQPLVTVLSGSTPVGTFTPTEAWADYPVRVPAAARAGDDLEITLRSSELFTGTARFADPRPKGVRVEYVAVRAEAPPGLIPAPAKLPLAMLAVNAALWLMTLLALSGRPNLSFVLTTLLVAAVAVALALQRAWTAAVLPWLTALGLLALLWAWRGALAGLAVRGVRAYGRGEALNYGLTAAGAAWLLAVAAWLSLNLPSPALRLAQDTFPDSLLYGLLGMALLLLVIVLGRNGLPRIARGVVGALGSRLGARLALAAFLLVWGGYLLSAIAVLPYVGHADYADNAVVARNLAAGRGWVVDYVTQFYQIYPTVTRPQETWPLMQPLWIAPLFALLGPSAWAAKLPNLAGLIALGLAVYAAGARLWDRRVGLTAAVLLLTSHLFFKLVIYVTSDLLFVLFAFGAIALLYAAAADSRRPVARWPLLGSAVLTGLMLLQKPGSGGLIALGMGLWLLAVRLRGVRREGPRRLAPVAAWGAVALLLLAPLLARNLATFGKLYYSTEGHDAWVLGYTDWDNIYGVYAPELGGPGEPDRSWLLRWGFDRTLAKIGAQAEAVRDYLSPGWQGLPEALAPAAGRADKDTRLLFDVGAWLALIGACGLLGARPRLAGLLLAAYLPYVLFLVLYWHADEERYFVTAMPWLALLAAYALWRSYDRVAAIGDGRWAPLGLAIAAVSVVLIVQPSWPKIAEKVRGEPQLYAADLDAYAWLRESTPAGSVMMTRNPWQLNWHAERPAVMIPFTTDEEALLRLARHYKARYLVLDSLQRPDPQVRELIARMLEDPRLGFREVYRTPVYVADYDGVRRELSAEVFAFPDDYGGAAPIP